MKLNKQAVKAIAYLSFSAGIVIGEGLYYAYVVRTEREKRKKIDEWEQENLACIERAHQRLIEVVNTQPFSWDEYWAVWREEERFLNIVRNQPKY
jgi:hypothetical protein